MLASRQLVRVAAPSIRAYATVKRTTNVAPPAEESMETAPPPIPMSSAPLYNPDAEPALHAMGYPALSSASRQLRNPKGWWDNQERVNFGEPVPENDDIQSMWAPDVHKIKPSSALSQLLLMFGAVGLFAFGVYEMRAQPHALPRAYPHDGIVQALSGTSDSQYAARTEAENAVEDE
ncbi:hypothetical protein RHOSPDRAFT_34214 [Rhodotorula sp. JG-1b]|nr:hypothetical protein RHOSPDRAFT_34214 [Rhodotorula sp. JG-1b]